MDEDIVKKADEYLNNWKRSAADLINYKKDEMERMGFLGKYAKEDIIYKVLPIIDSIMLAQAHMPQELKNSTWMQGFNQIQNQITDFLKKEGIEEIKVLGEMFDPTTMEIVEQVDGGQSGTVAQELQKGYKINDKILRPAKVKVNK